MRPPIVHCRWTGDAFVPWSLYAVRKYYKPGETYPLVVSYERSNASHSHYFAALDDRWQSLPEHLQDEYPTRESMRHKILIKCGYCVERDWVFPTDNAATQFAAALIEADEECYCIIDVRGRVVRRYRALSQSYPAMDKAQFEKSKQDVLNYVERHLLGLDEPLDLHADT